MPDWAIRGALLVLFLVVIWMVAQFARTHRK
jgi:hypothetical protein